MTPVQQDKFGEGEGNCFAACVATLLDLPLAEVPNFCIAAPPRNWWAEFQDWLRDRGCYAVEVRTKGLIVALPYFPVHVVLSGRSPRGDFDHSVVGVAAECGGFKMCHDPHPSGAGIEGEPTHVLFLGKLL